VIALNMIDAAERDGIRIDVERLRRELGCPIVPMAARSGRGLEDLQRELLALLEPPLEWKAPPRQAPVCGAGCLTCPYQARYEWTEGVSARVMKAPIVRGLMTERLDRWLTHPVVGLLVFIAVMTVTFFLIFRAASIPMDLIDRLFATAGARIAPLLPDGDLRSLVVNGVIGGVGGILVFLPQICILFFVLALLEDSGYLARAAFVMDRLMRRVGLPGNAFVPLLSAHACAIPAIMSSRVVADPRDRLLTILVTPLMTCSARIPVYSMVVALLFPAAPLKAALTFVGAYSLGVVAALTMALVFRRTILPGESHPLIIELPHYRLPALRTALIQTYDRAAIFVKQAGTVILVISISLWALATYPKSSPPPEVAAIEQQAVAATAAGDAARADDLREQGDRLAAHAALEHSFAGRIGRAIEPALRPLGFDWQIGIGIVSSFAAREVIVSTLAIIYGVGEGGGNDNLQSLYDTLRAAVRPDGSRMFSTATCFSLLIFYILAAQCLPTQAVVRRETNSWKWPLFQIAYMSALAYVAALVTYQGLRALGIT
jgi:ferrous iron transport protein B